MRKFSAVLLPVLMTLSTFSFAEKRVLILPPRNLGRIGDEASDVIQRSLSWVLEEAVDDVVVVSPDETENVLKKFPNAVKNVGQALSAGQEVGASLVVMGTYRVRGTEEEGTITAKMSIYDVISGKKRLERQFKGPAGIDLFDTIDNIALGLAGGLIGRKLHFASITITVSGSESSYSVYLSGKKVGTVSASSPYTRKVIAGKDYELILRNEFDKEVFRKVFRLKADESKEFVYKPSGSMKIEVTGLEPNKKVEVFVNGEKKGEPPLILKNIPANIEYSIEVKDSKGKVVASGKQFLGEGETTVVRLQAGAGLPRRIYFIVSSLGNAYAWGGARYYITYNIFAGVNLGVTFSKQTDLVEENVLIGVASLNAGYVFVGNLKRGFNVYSSLDFTIFRSFDYKVDSSYLGLKVGAEFPSPVRFLTPFVEAGGRMSTDGNNFSAILQVGLRI